MASNTYLIIFLSIISTYGSVISSPILVITRAELNFDGCQSTSIQKYGYYNVPFCRMDSPTLKHVTLQKNASGITLFEMYVTVKSNDNFDVLLSYQADNIDGHTENFYSISITPCAVTLYLKRGVVSTTQSLNLLSWDHFTEYFIKIKNDWLLFGIRGHPPILSYTDTTIKTMQHFSFSTSNSDITKPPQIYFDCP